MDSTPKELYLVGERICMELNYNRMWYVLCQSKEAYGGGLSWGIVCHTALVQSSLQLARGPRAVPKTKCT